MDLKQHLPIAASYRLSKDTETESESMENDISQVETKVTKTSCSQACG